MSTRSSSPHPLYSRHNGRSRRLRQVRSGQHTHFKALRHPNMFIERLLPQRDKRHTHLFKRRKSATSLFTGWAPCSALGHMYGCNPAYKGRAVACIASTIEVMQLGPVWLQHCPAPSPAFSTSQTSVASLRSMTSTQVRCTVSGRYGANPLRNIMG